VKKSIGIWSGAFVAPVAAVALLVGPGHSSATSHQASVIRAGEETLTLAPVQPLEVLEEADRLQEVIQIAGPVRRAVRRADRRHDRRESRRDRRDDRREHVEDRRDDRRERVEDRRDDRKERWR
jgi:hypothetical protein